MAIRIKCPACDAPNTVDEEKRGRKVRCRKCDELISVPAAKKAGNDDSIQESKNVKVKAGAGKKREVSDDDEDEVRPAKKTAKGAGGGSSTLLLVGGIAVLLLMCLVGAGGIGGFFYYRSRSVNAAEQQAQAADLKGKDGDQKKDEKPADLKGKKPIEDGRDKIENLKDKDENPRDKLAVDPDAGKPLPADLPPALVSRIKQATVYLKVTMPNGQDAEGSGFFAMERGIVITNAHVLGMLKSGSALPKNVQVVVDNGQPKKTQLAGEVLGVDRTNDLAVVRVKDANLPAPLLLETQRQLIETQKVYIIGFPFGAQLGEEVTVNSAGVSSFRKDPQTGELDRIQVDKGMDPGNSGGPVVNAGGNVIGVSVAGIRGSNINFAVPAEKVRLIMEGKFAEAKHGEAFAQAGGARLPVNYKCLDPLNRIRDMRVEVWVGPPGPPRAGSFQKPQPAAGDGPRQNHAIAYRDGVGNIEIPLPKFGANEVCWIQPVLTTAKGNYWGPAQATPVNMAVLERVPADLTISFTAQKERSSSLTSVYTSTLAANKKRLVRTEHVKAELYEVLFPEDYRGRPAARIKTAYGPLSIDLLRDGKKIFFPELPKGLGIVRTMPPLFVIDQDNGIASYITVTLGAKNPMRDIVSDLNGMVQNPLEAATIRMPNKMVQPTDTFDTKASMMYREDGKNIFADLMLKCTYHGKRVRDGRDEAVMSLVGTMEGRNEFRGKIEGNITGKVAFDLTGKFLSHVQLKIAADAEYDTEFGKITRATEHDIEVTRVAGNPKNLALAPEKGPGPGPDLSKPIPTIAKGAVIFNQGLQLAATDLLDPKAPPSVKAHMKVIPVQLQAGKSYVISMNSKAFDTYLRLESPQGQILAKDDDSGGDLNARIIYRATQTGVHRVIATSYTANSTGPFQLTVQELDAGKGGPVASGAKIVGGAFDPEFKDEAPAGSVLVGLELGLGKFVKNDVVKAVRPIYRDAKGKESKGQQYGKDLTRVVTIKAKDGYAIGSLNVRAGLGLDAITAVFMRVSDGKLDAKDSYQSNNVGGNGGGPSTLTGDGALIVGIVGKHNQNDCTGIGLLVKAAGPGDVKSDLFKRPAKSAAPTSYLKINSAPGDYIGQGKNYDYAGDKLTAKNSVRGIHVSVDGWSLNIAAPAGQMLKVGEYVDAKRFPFNGPSPGLDFSGKGRGSNKLSGEFVIWELEIEGDRVVRAAIDFVQRSEGSRNAPLTGKLRINSSLE